MLLNIIVTLIDILIDCHIAVGLNTILKNTIVWLDFIGALTDIEIFYHFSMVMQTEFFIYKCLTNKLIFQIIPWRVFVVNCAQIWPNMMSMRYSTNCEGKCSTLRTNSISSINDRN